MSTIVTKPTPRPVLNGILNKASRTPLPEVEQLPQDLAHVVLLTERGKTKLQLVAGDGASSSFGAYSFDMASPYANHQTFLALTKMRTGSQVMIERLKPAAATTAVLRFSVEVITTTLPVYERNDDGTIKYELVDDELTPVLDSTITGTRLVWHRGVSIYPSADAKKYAGGVVINNYRLGSVVGSDSVTKLGEIVNGPNPAIVAKSILYPILDLDVTSFGDYGNRIGLRFTAPTVNSDMAYDVSMSEAVKAYIYRLCVVEKSRINSTSSIQRTIGSDLFVEGTLKANTINAITNKPFALAETFIAAYERTSVPDTADIDGPFGRMYLYEANLNTILTNLTQGGEDADGNEYIGEMEYDDQAVYPIDTSYRRTYNFADATNKHYLNIFTGRDYNGIPYYTFDVQNSQLFGGVSFDNDAVHYAEGGSDGLILDSNGRPDRLANLKIFDDLAYNCFSNWGDLETPMLDTAKYPVSSIWDSGFSHATKAALLVPMARRKDMFIVLSTQAIADTISSTWKYVSPNTNEQEISYGMALLNKALLYPESSVFGTAAVRAIIIGHCGQLVSEETSGYLPLTIDFADKVSKYMGAGNGKWRTDYAMDKTPNNQVTMFKNVNLTYKNESSYDRSWSAGINWVQNYNRQRLFYPALQTVFPDETSVLNSFLVAVAACTLERICQTVWRDLVGNNLTKEQFIEKSNTLITQRTDGIFDGRFTIEPNTYFTAADEVRGYSWSCDVTIRATTMKTVGTFTIIADRLED